ncbi:kunitz-type serine protease inhibitor HCRG1-like [Drosophila innubila]|uniref:kunitz-type serine protease inhibitor HCRG1-like n=1 Tax=Drosophila innubila TaxID=198719 RepID=UPI00148C7959|nr:kunitz-type serine protease inhibitor HCRG1-like [Drosophila innubila]XP_034475767.1 kunitz-type serine protease inhibitor HCRG1-like [Drosophila innubila]
MKINLLRFCCCCQVLLLSLSLISAWTVDDLIHRMGICSEPPRYGTCKAQLRKWYYISKLKKCKPFIYSGCGGNENRFYNKMECEEYCQI